MENNQQSFKDKFEIIGAGELSSYVNIFKNRSIWIGSVERTLAIEMVGRLNEPNNWKTLCEMVSEENKSKGLKLYAANQEIEKLKELLKAADDIIVKASGMIVTTKTMAISSFAVWVELDKAVKKYNSLKSNP